MSCRHPATLLSSTSGWPPVVAFLCDFLAYNHSQPAFCAGAVVVPWPPTARAQHSRQERGHGPVIIHENVATTVPARRLPLHLTDLEGRRCLTGRIDRDSSIALRAPRRPQLAMRQRRDRDRLSRPTSRTVMRVTQNAYRVLRLHMSCSFSRLVATLSSKRDQNAVATICAHVSTYRPIGITVIRTH